MCITYSFSKFSFLHIKFVINYNKSKSSSFCVTFQTKLLYNMYDIFYYAKKKK